MREWGMRGFNRQGWGSQGSNRNEEWMSLPGKAELMRFKKINPYL